MTGSRRAGFLLIAAAFTGVFAGCGGSQSTATGSGTSPTTPTPGTNVVFYSGTFKGTSTITECTQTAGLPTFLGFCASDPARPVGVVWAPATVVFNRTGTQTNLSGWFQFFDNGVGQLRYQLSGTVASDNSIAVTITNNLSEHRLGSLTFTSADSAGNSYTGNWQMTVAENRGVPGDNAGTLKGRLSLTRATPCQFFDVIC